MLFLIYIGILNSLELAFKLGLTSTNAIQQLRNFTDFLLLNP